jgi:CSLREA domain-containing protein
MNKIIRISAPFMIAFLFISILIWLAGASSRATAAPSLSTPVGAILVTTLEDELNTDSDCSLREAIEAANTNLPVDACPAGDAVITDTIAFDVMGTITVTSQLSVTADSPLVIDGGGVITTSGGGTTRVWIIENGEQVSLQNLVIENGYTVSIYFKDISGGSGIYNKGNLTIINSSINNNIALGSCGEWGCLGAGGGINNEGTLSMINSVLSGNDSYVGGGGIRNIGLLFVTNTVVSQNSSPIGGGFQNMGTLIFVNSTCLDNYAADVGGCIWNSNTLSITNSTFSGNSAFLGGAIDNYIIGILNVINSTITNNSASEMGGGIYNDYGSSTLTSTIVANNPDGGDCSGPITDGGHNISSDDTCGFDPANGSMPNTDPLLGPLQDNGGPTWTHALMPGSPAIDTGDDAQCPPSDQRGVPRPQDGNGDGEAICDIGSYELEGPWVSPTLVTISGPGEGIVGQSFLFTATVDPISTTLPLEYVWQTSKQAPITNTGGLTDIVSFTWEMPGTQIITVTASNPAGAVSASHVITIATPIYETYLPLVIISIGKPLESVPASSSPEGGVLLSLVTVGIVGIRMRRGRLLLEHNLPIPSGKSK